VYQKFFLQGNSGWGVKLTTLLYLLLILQISGPIPLLLPYAFMAWTMTTLPLHKKLKKFLIIKHQLFSDCHKNISYSAD
jgi:hypothetical protein